MTRLFKWLRGFLFENFGWKLLALAIAIVLWAFVASEPELTTFASVRLEYKGLPDDLEISSEPVNSISLELLGPAGELRGVSDGGIHPAVVLDMASITPGERTFAIGNGNVKLARSVRLVRAIPSEVRFRFERRSYKTVPVVVRLAGNGMNGYYVAHQDVVPSELRIVGPASRVDKTKVAVTDPIDVSTTVGSSEFRANAFIEDPYVRFQSSPQVAVTVTMKKQ